MTNHTEFSSAEVLSLRDDHLNYIWERYFLSGKRGDFAAYIRACAELGEPLTKGDMLIAAEMIDKKKALSD
jgi:hypothetical protein